MSEPTDESIAEAIGLAGTDMAHLLGWRPDIVREVASNPKYYPNARDLARSILAHAKTLDRVKALEARLRTIESLPRHSREDEAEIIRAMQDRALTTLRSNPDAA